MPRGRTVRPIEEVAGLFASATAALPRFDIGKYYLVEVHHDQIGSLIGQSTRTASRLLKRLIDNNILYKGALKKDIIQRKSKVGYKVVNLMYAKGSLIDDLIKKKNIQKTREVKMAELDNPFAPKNLSDKDKVYLGTLFPLQFPEWAGHIWHDPNKKFRRTKEEMEEYTAIMSERGKRTYMLNEELYKSDYSVGAIFRIIDKADNLIIKSNVRGVITYYTPREIKGAFLLSRMWDLYTMDMLKRDKLENLPDFTMDKFNWDFRTLPQRFLGHGRLTVYLRLEEKLIKDKINPCAFMEPVAKWWFSNFNPVDKYGNKEEQTCSGRLHILYPHFLLGDLAEELYYRECKYAKKYMVDLSGVKLDENGKEIRKERITNMQNSPDMRMLNFSWGYFIKGESRQDYISAKVEEFINNNLLEDEVRGGVARWYKRLAPKLTDKKDLKGFLDQQVYWKYLTDSIIVDDVLTLGSSSIRMSVVLGLRKLDEDIQLGKKTSDDIYSTVRSLLFGNPAKDNNMSTYKEAMLIYNIYSRRLNKDLYSQEWLSFTRTAELAACVQGLSINLDQGYAYLGTEDAPIFKQIADINQDIPLNELKLLDMSKIYDVERSGVGRDRDELDDKFEQKKKSTDDFIANLQEQFDKMQKQKQEEKDRLARLKPSTKSGEDKVNWDGREDSIESYLNKFGMGLD